MKLKLRPLGQFGSLQVLVFMANILFFSMPWTSVQSQEPDAHFQSPQQEYQEILDLEKDLENEKTKLQEEKLTTSDLYKKFQSTLSKNNNSKEESANDMSALAEYVNEWNKKHKSYHEKMDSYTIKQLDYFIKQTHNDANKALDKVLSKKLPSNVAKNKDIQVLRDKMNQYYTDYFKNKDQYGKGMDKLRMYPYRDFFLTGEKIAKKLEGLSRNKDKESFTFPTAKEILSGTYDKLAAFRHLKHLKAIVPLTSMIHHALNPSKGKKKSTPLVTNFEKIYKEYGEIQGFKIKLKGEENLSSENETAAKPTTDSEVRKKITIYASSHRDEDGDTVAIPEIGSRIGDHIIFAAAYNFLPLKLAKKVDNSPDIIVVGGPKDVRKYENPLDKLFEMIEIGVSDKFIIFPQGSTSLINEFHPAREKSTWEALTKKGYDVEIVPISIDVSPRMLSESGSVDDKNIKVTISPKISSEMYSKLIEMSGNDQQVINRYLRSLWVEKITKYGHMSNDELSKKIQDKIVGKLQKVAKSKVLAAQKDDEIEIPEIEMSDFKKCI